MFLYFQFMQLTYEEIHYNSIDLLTLSKLPEARSQASTYCVFSLRSCITQAPEASPGSTSNAAVLIPLISKPKFQDDVNIIQSIQLRNRM